MPPKVISGISSCFQLLFQCQGQVAHVLLTRSPLVYPRRGLTVRLACVKHAASVRPEPGSNSPLKSIQIRRNDQRRFVVSTRSIADKKTQAGSSSINQRNPNSDHAEGVLRARGFFVHYLALTFSTLLSSQVSGAHRTELVGLRLGAATHITRSGKSESNPDLLVHPGPSEGPDLMHLLRAHIYPNISLASGFLPGRPLQIDNLTRPAPPLRPHLLYACATERSNRPDRCACASSG